MLHKLENFLNESRECPEYAGMSQSEILLKLTFEWEKDHQPGFTFFDTLNRNQKKEILKDLGHNLAWVWFDKQTKEKQDKILKDVEYSVTIWYNRKGEEWQQELENFVEASIGHDPEI